MASIFPRWSFSDTRIFHLALQSEFDGMLILSNNIASYNRIESLMQQIRSRDIPCISLEQDVPDFHFIGTNTAGFPAYQSKGPPINAKHLPKPSLLRFFSR